MSTKKDEERGMIMEHILTVGDVVIEKLFGRLYQLASIKNGRAKFVDPYTGERGPIVRINATDDFWQIFKYCWNVNEDWTKADVKNKKLVASFKLKQPNSQQK